MPEARFRHLDQEKWQEVRAQDHGGRRVSVREKWLEFTPSCMTLYAEWDPGMIVHKHGHNSDHIIFVIGAESPPLLALAPDAPSQPELMAVRQLINIGPVDASQNFPR